MNKKIVTAFLAAMLAVGATGCGDVKDSGSDAPAPADTQVAETTTTAATTAAPETTTTTAAADKALTADEAAKDVGNEIDKAQKAALGELDGGYKAVVTYTAPKSGELAEKGIKPVTLTMEAKQKDKLTGMTYELGYDSKGLLTVNAVYDNEKEIAYASVPELSDGVLTGNIDDIKQMVQDSVNPQALGAEGEQIAASADSFVAASADSFGGADFEALQNIDVQALSDDLATYIDTFKENFPEGVDAGEYKVSSDGVDIALKTKSYTVTPEQTKQLGKAISDKGLADDTLKDLFKACGVSDDDYKNLWNTYSNFDTENAETTYFDIYYNSDETPVGIAIKSDEKTVKNRAVIAYTDTDVIIDCDLGDESSTKTAKGHISYQNETLNGKIVIKNKDDYTDQKVSVEYKDLTVNNDKCVGDVVISQTVDGEEAMKITYSMDVTSEGGTMDMTMKANGEDMGSIKMVMQTTDASDITIPTGTTYKLSSQEELQKFSESCNVEGWQENVKKALGEELYNEVFAAAQAENAAVEDAEAASKDAA